jgi:hypothetical protein
MYELKDVNWQRWYAAGITPGMACRAFEKALTRLVTAERTARIERGEFLADWPEWLITGEYLPAGIRAEFARILELDVERQDTHELFDWTIKWGQYKPFIGQ